ncbi:MAG: dihydropteroate synthase [Pseudomonadota bacterium]
MGIVNVTPDSFSDGGLYYDCASAVAHGERLVADGADILDIGAESTRPGAAPVPADEECQRLIPVIEALSKRVKVPISVDTRKAAVAKAAIRAGASIWNDVSALTYDPASLEMAADLGAPVILMHAQGDPQTMQDAPAYDDVVEEVYAFLKARMDACLSAGIPREKITIDPGVGFGKILTHNLALLASLSKFTDLAPVLLGASRKRFIAAVDRDGPAETRIGGSIAAAIAGAAAGVFYVRVHDVAETRQALAVHNAIAGVNASAQLSY